MLLLTYRGTTRSPLAYWEDDFSLALSRVLPSWLLHTHTHAHVTAFVSLIHSYKGRQDFPPLFSIQSPFHDHRGALSRPPGPKVPQTARLSDKTPLTLLHYEAMIGGASQVHTSPAYTCSPLRYTYRYTLEFEIHKFCKHIYSSRFLIELCQ